MVDSVDVRRNQNPPQHGVNLEGDADIAMNKNGRKREDCFCQQDGCNRRTKKGNKANRRCKEEDRLKRMEPEGCGEVVIQIRVMHAVDPPQHRNIVEHPVLDIAAEVESNQDNWHDQPGRRGDLIEQAPVVGSGPNGRSNDKARKEQTGKRGAYEVDREIANPAGSQWRDQLAPGGQAFPNGGQRD